MELARIYFLNGWYHAVEFYLTEIMFSRERGTFILGDHSQGVVNGNHPYVTSQTLLTLPKKCKNTLKQLHETPEKNNWKHKIYFGNKLTEYNRAVKVTIKNWKILGFSSLLQLAARFYTVQVCPLSSFSSSTLMLWELNWRALHPHLSGTVFDLASITASHEKDST